MAQTCAKDVHDASFTRVFYDEHNNKVTIGISPNLARTSTCLPLFWSCTTLSTTWNLELAAMWGTSRRDPRPHGVSTAKHKG